MCRGSTRRNLPPCQGSSLSTSASCSAPPSSHRHRQLHHSVPRPSIMLVKVTTYPCACTSSRIATPTPSFILELPRSPSSRRLVPKRQYHPTPSMPTFSIHSLPGGGFALTSELAAAAGPAVTRLNRDSTQTGPGTEHQESSLTKGYGKVFISKSGA
eukprot:758902-Hanusia_phi.AAC.3